MVKPVLFVGALLAASQAFGEDWQRPDCSAFESFSECRNAQNNDYRRQKQKEFRELGLSFWYFERPDFSDNKEIEQAQEDKVEGALYFSFSVGIDGRVSAVSLQHKSSDAVEVYAAPILAAIQNWQFVPSDKSWPDLKWSYQFFFDPEACDEEDGESEACKAEDESDS
ncbi:hypothetical protein PVT68_15570 [Microbulbifer bruguierae]|uniref:TonB C-terminal domain-containing protein n=1 Tax=Microbulbifer bruguierae TaxID=3029061 RepID=A0ABY8NCP2_9GAMM|nr:hypothetical protein [Microbulbifer bruguierae]WGL16179.1 hypothetical protein PVT68_15570 [Microbulbifer bruguierae]